MTSNGPESCSPNATDVDGDGLCDLLEVLNGSDPFSAESTLDVDAHDASVISVTWTESGFQVDGEHCIGGQWKLLDLTGRTVLSGRIEAFNPMAVSAGSYVLSFPEFGFNEVHPVQR